MSSLRAFPPELHDHIIDLSFDDKPTLLACSLVCREWRVTSQYHLFRTVQVRHPTALSSFNDFLQDSPHVRGFIRDLSLCGSNLSTGTAYDEQMPVTTYDISRCVSHLPKLDSLLLDGIWWGDASPRETRNHPASPDAALSAAPNLRQLTIRKVFTTPDVLLDTICAFASIGALNIERVYWTYGVACDDVAPPPERKPSIRSLEVGPGSTYNMLQRFLPLVEKRVDVNALDSLSLEFEHFDAWRELRGFLQHVSPRLKRLSLKFGKYAVISESTSQLKDLELSSFSSLQSFQVYLPGEDANVVDPLRSWTLLHSLLPLLPPTVNDLTVVHKMHLEMLESRMTSVDWKLVDDLLASPAFKTLSDVTIRADPTCHSQEAHMFHCFSSDDLWNHLVAQHERSKSVFKQRLPQLDARGILSVE